MIDHQRPVGPLADGAGFARGCAGATAVSELNVGSEPLNPGPNSKCRPETALANCLRSAWQSRLRWSAPLDGSEMRGGNPAAGRLSETRPHREPSWRVGSPPVGRVPLTPSKKKPRPEGTGRGLFVQRWCYGHRSAALQFRAMTGKPEACSRVWNYGAWNGAGECQTVWKTFAVTPTVPLRLSPVT
jgi:hypothetical protein